jgi:translocation and assembly module TamA
MRLIGVMMNLTHPHLLGLIVLVFVTAGVQAEEPQVRITGISDALLTNVKGYLTLNQEPCDAPEWRIRNLFTRSDRQIKKALRALGYYQPLIEKQLKFTESCWETDFTINPGLPVHIHQIEIQVQGEAETDPAFKTWVQKIPIHPGDILNHADYEKIKNEFNALALELGYLKHQMLEKTLRVNTETRLAEIKLIFDSGPQHYFGDLHIEQTVLEPIFVERYLQIEPGEPYINKALAATYNALSESSYFSRVDLQPDMEATVNHQVPLTIKLTPKEKHDYRIGVGFDTDLGPLATAGYKNRRVNRYGHQITTDLDLSPVLSTFEARYILPFIQPVTDQVSIGIGYKLEQPDSFESEMAKFSLQYQHLLPESWKQTLFWDWSREKFTVSKETQVTHLSVLGGRWQKTVSNRAKRPTRGYLIDLALSGALQPILSDTSFLQLTLNSKQITPLPWDARLITRANLGATLSREFSRLPSSYRFYTGGTQTIRGYSYKSLGPRDHDGEIIGGQFLTVASIEYEHFINDQWGIATFVDAGNAFNSDFITVKYGIGLGIRWQSPIGQLRLDVAFPSDTAYSFIQFHFAAGAQL